MLVKFLLSLFAFPYVVGVAAPPPQIEGDARAMVLMNKAGEILTEKNREEALPIASLTKLMTAMVFLDEKVPFEREVELFPEDDRIGGKLYIFRGEKVTVRDLFYSSLIGSANNATVALARITGLPEEEFVEKMNQKAKKLDLKTLSFKEPSGLSPKNVGSAQDIAKLLHESLKIPEIKKALSTKEYVFETLNTREPHRIKNTNTLWESFLASSPYEMRGGKTGYLDEAGYCLALLVKKGDEEFVAVILGSPTDEERFSYAKRVLYWGFERKKN